jgi:hypothetical protein
METKKVLLCLTIATVLWIAPTEATSREVHLRMKYSGSALSTHEDTNGDGIKAGLGTVSCRSNLGRCTSQGVGEAVVDGPATCRNGNQGLELVLIPGTGHALLRFEDTGDLLFTELTSETVCYDPSTGTQFKTGSDHITGGTGRFVGATGQLQFEGTQWPLYIDPNGDGFAAQIGTLTGTILVVDEGNRQLERSR